LLSLHQPHTPPSLFTVRSLSLPSNQIIAILLSIVAFHHRYFIVVDSKSGGAKQWSTLFPTTWRTSGTNSSLFAYSNRKRLQSRFYVSAKNGGNGAVVDDISETVKAHTNFVWPDNKVS
jgi:hypothetical protein